VADRLRGELIQRARVDATLALRIAVPAAEGVALRLFESRPDADRFYWEQPSADRALCGVGVLSRVETRGPDRFQHAADASRALFDALVLVGDRAPAWAGPLLVGGFAFEPDAVSMPGGPWQGFEPLSFGLPELLYVRDAEQAWLTAAVQAGEAPQAAADRLIATVEACAAALSTDGRAPVLNHPPATATEYCARPDRPHALWLADVDAAVEAMRRGEFEKVVLARSLGVETDVAYEIASVLSSLRAVERSCTTFAVTRGERSFLGASPERLVRLDGDRLSTSALAGSAPRGRSPEEDERFARQLRESKKEQEEHAFVAREIAASLEPFCEDVAFPEAPGLLALDGIQHLETPFLARLRSEIDPSPHLLELAAALHPTPAVCGTPRGCAARWLREHEQLERGWYAGGVGYIDARGSGELAVALRSGLLHGCSARLYAGAGLVEASQPEAELAETRLKLRALLSQLTEI
jgi:isochorismate synthase